MADGYPATSSRYRVSDNLSKASLHLALSSDNCAEHFVVAGHPQRDGRVAGRAFPAG